MDQFEWLKALQSNALRSPNELQRMSVPSRAVIDQIERETRIYRGLHWMLDQGTQRYLNQQEQTRDLMAGYMKGVAAAKFLGLERTNWASLLGSSLEPTYVEGLAVAKSLGLEQNKWASLLGKLERDGLMASHLSAAALPSMVWASNMDLVLASIRSMQIPDLYPDLTDRLIAPYTGYSRFARQTVARIGSADEAAETGALAGALVLAEEQVSEAADLLADTIEETTVESVEDDGLVPQIKPRLLRVQRKELLLAREIPEDADVHLLVSLAPSAVLAAKAREIVGQIVRCNRLARGLGDDNVFKPTTSFMEAQNNLSWIAVVNTQSLGDLVDSLYLMLYEGAGRDNLRYLQYINGEDCGVIWTIKHLRNKWLRHDPEHGKPADIKRSFIDLRNALGSLGINGQPRRKEEFQLIHKNLLDQVGQLLDRLEEALSAREIV
jgi:hypothetical protein